MPDVLKAIDEALAQKGLSDAAASRLAAGNPSLIKNLRSSAGRYSFDALQKVADVLDLECYFGPPRGELSTQGGRPPMQSLPPPDPLPVIGMSEPDAQSWCTLDRPQPRKPHVISAPPGASAPAPYGLVDPGADLVPGEYVLAQDLGDRAVLARYLGRDANGWSRLAYRGLEDLRPPSGLASIWPIVAWSRTPSALGSDAQADRLSRMRAALDRAIAQLETMQQAITRLDQDHRHTLTTLRTAMEDY